MIAITSQAGQVGPLWWVNSSPGSAPLTLTDGYTTYRVRQWHWGGWGWGSRSFVRVIVRQERIR